MAEGGSPREGRVGRNEALFREVNERIEELAVFHDFGASRFELVCECANLECAAVIDMTVSEYEAVRADGRRFLVAPAESHVVADVERIVERFDRYWVVEKTGGAAEVAADNDPRAEDE